MKAIQKGKLIFSVLVLSSMVFSCLPEENERVSTGVAGQIEELKATSTFDWATSRVTDVSIKGLKVLPEELKRRVNVKDQQGHVYYSGFHSISEDLVFSLDLPNHINFLTLQFGEIVKEGEVIGGKVQFDYLPVVDDSDIQ